MLYCLPSDDPTVCLLLENPSDTSPAEESAMFKEEELTNLLPGDLISRELEGDPSVCLTEGEPVCSPEGEPEVILDSCEPSVCFPEGEPDACLPEGEPDVCLSEGEPVCSPEGEPEVSSYSNKSAVCLSGGSVCLCA